LSQGIHEFLANISEVFTFFYNLNLLKKFRNYKKYVTISICSQSLPANDPWDPGPLPVRDPGGRPAPPRSISSVNSLSLSGKCLSVNWNRIWKRLLPAPSSFVMIFYITSLILQRKINSKLIAAIKSRIYGRRFPSHLVSTQSQIRKAVTKSSSRCGELFKTGERVWWTHFCGEGSNTSFARLVM